MKRIALITGATSGIGKATAIAFAREGIDLILCGRRAERLNALQSELSEKVKVHTLEFDVSDQSRVNDVIQGLPEEWNAIDILVNNAGNAYGFDTLDEGNTDDWDKMVDINVKGLLYVSKAVIPGMVGRKKGHIVNISSIAGKETYAKGTVYCASKSAVESISEGMRLELVPKGIKVTNIAPGAVETEFSEVRFKGDKDRASKVYQGFDPLLAEDIARSIAFCVTQPPHVQIADMTIFAAAQSAATTIDKK